MAAFISHWCFLCGGSAHPATGCVYSPTCILCHRCTREQWRWVKGWTNARMKQGHYFYQCAGLGMEKAKDLPLGKIP